MSNPHNARGASGVLAAGLIAVCLLTTPAHAQDGRVTALESELAAQRDRIARLEALVERQNQLLEQLAAKDHSFPAAAASSSQPAAPATAKAAPVAVQSPSAPAALAGGGLDRFRIPGLDVSGDLRLREEFNFSDADARDRTRTVLRTRLRASYKLNDRFAVGAQLTTGDPDDPNSTDVTLGSFADDLDVSLDQAWLRYQTDRLALWGGKFPLPFVRTDMVWDGDVSPQGVGATYSLPLGDAAKLDARAIYFVIDEASNGADSDMIGVQGVLATPLSRDLKLTLAGAYYRYGLNSLVGADAGDFRSNLIAGGRYLSNFRLVNGTAALAWSGLGARWPVTLTGDYVHNHGAAVSSDSGFNVELGAGRIVARGDWRFAYNYSEVGVDAVFAAFSHDNLNIATNYRLHGLGVDYVPVDNVVLNATLYHYRPLDPLYAGANDPSDWLNRVRLNMLLSF